MLTLKNLENLTQREIGYIAGIIDGEGSIGICTSFGKRSKNPSHYIRLNTSNTCKELMEWYKDIIGGTIGHYAPIATPHSVWKHYLTGENAYRVIKLVQDSLIVKREQAKLAIYFYEHKKLIHKGVNGNLIPKEELEWRELMKQKISILNGLNGFEKALRYKDLQRLNEETSHLR